MQRSGKQIEEQYRVEIELADRLRQASRDERRGLYSKVYDELYTRVPHHPGVARQQQPSVLEARVREQIRPIRPYLTPQTIFLEIGAGDCRLALALTSMVSRVLVVEVSNEKALKRLQVPANFESVLSDGVDFNVPYAGEITVAYSNQVIEHLHPEDAAGHMRDVHRALAPGGVFVCRTPHLFVGPSDVSKHFDRVPRGMHLKEYTVLELVDLMRDAGFRSVKKQVAIGAHVLNVPTAPCVAIEGMVAPLPYLPRRILSRALPLRPILSLCLVARK